MGVKNIYEQRKIVVNTCTILKVAIRDKYIERQGRRRRYECPSVKQRGKLSRAGAGDSCTRSKTALKLERPCAAKAIDKSLKEKRLVAERTL